MRYHPVPGLDREVSELSFGCGLIGGLVAKASFEEQCAVFQAALDGGINFFDTAANYGGGRSEEVVGKVFAELGAEPVIATKINLIGEDFADLRGAIRRSVDTSKARLGRERLDIFYLHNRLGRSDDPQRGVVSAATVLRTGGVADLFDELVASGEVGTLAFCGFGHTNAALEVLRSERFSMTQLPINLLNPSGVVEASAAWRQQDFGNLATEAAARGLFVVGFRVLAAGALSGTGFHPYRADVPPMVAAEDAADRARAQAYAFLADEPGGLARSAVRYVLGCGSVHNVLLGISDAEQLADALAAVHAGPLEAPLVERIHATFDDLFLTV